MPPAVLVDAGLDAAGANGARFAVTVLRDGAVVHDDVFTADFGSGNDSGNDSDSDCSGDCSGDCCVSRHERIDL